MTQFNSPGELRSASIHRLHECLPALQGRRAMSVRSASGTLMPAVVAWVVGLASTLQAGAQDIPGYPPNFDAYDSREMAMLPPFCMYTMLIRDKVPGGTDNAKTAAWQATLGPTFIHLHHYCWGLMK